jgi:glutamyl-tRNA reductase
VRERLDFSSRDLGTAVEALATRPSAAESVVLSTCNRSEIYVASGDPTRAREELVEFLSDYHQLPRDSFLPHLFSYDDAEAARHLFRVAAGLDSLVVGEPQILGQVKEAFQTAAQRHCTGPLLGKVFEWAFGVGKRVRTETTLGEGAVSVSYAAVALARKIFGRLQGRRVLVVGAGEISTLTAQHLRTHGVAEITITSRTPAHAEALAAAVQGQAVAWSEMTPALSRADIVITATGSQRPILTRANVEAVTGRRRHDPLFIIDIAVPRDVEPSVGDIEQVFLYNVDDLQTIVDENMSRRGAEIARAEAIVSEELARFTAWQRSRSAIPTVVALRQRFDAIRRAELQRLEGKLAGLPPEGRARVDEVTRLIVEKLLIEPTEQLKALPDEETQVAYTEAVNRLFRLREDDAPDSQQRDPGRGSSATIRPQRPGD